MSRRPRFSRPGRSSPVSWPVPFSPRLLVTGGDDNGGNAGTAAGDAGSVTAGVTPGAVVGAGGGESGAPGAAGLRTASSCTAGRSPSSSAGTSSSSPSRSGRHAPASFRKTGCTGRTPRAASRESGSASTVPTTPNHNVSGTGASASRSRLGYPKCIAADITAPSTGVIAQADSTGVQRMRLADANLMIIVFVQVRGRCEAPQSRGHRVLQTKEGAAWRPRGHPGQARRPHRRIALRALFGARGGPRRTGQRRTQSQRFDLHPGTRGHRTRTRHLHPKVSFGPKKHQGVTMWMNARFHFGDMPTAWVTAGDWRPLWVQ